MIPRLASPSVCVIDDEEDDFKPILDALMALGLGCVHVRGRSGDPLPPRPFEALRLVFADLHLSGQVGKAAASHTANVVRKVVSANSGPILLVIWSKYANDPAGDVSLPPEDQPTEADLFKAELLSAEPKFSTRLIFAEMMKPKLPDRPAADEWIQTLQSEIEATLRTIGAFDFLWEWEALVRGAGIEVSETLAKLAENSVMDGENVGERLKLILKLLAQQQGGPDSSVATASRHLLTVFSQIGLDSLEASATTTNFGVHGEWLAQELPDDVKRRQHYSKLNAILLTASANPSAAAFVPGTVYEVLNIEAMTASTGFSVDHLQRDCFEGNSVTSSSFADFKSGTRPVLIEITPSCDFHQGNRRCATLVAGLICPMELYKKAKSKEACKTTPVFEDRYVTPPIEIGFVFCGRYRFTTDHTQHPSWLQPRLRLRELVVADIRNWHSSQASRVGYLSF